MNETFWNLFGDDTRANGALWRRSPGNPVISAEGDSWKAIWTANPDVFTLNGRRLLYYRGHGALPGRDGGPHDRIGVAETLSVGRDSLEIRDLHDGPIVDVGQGGAFDDQHALDPAAIENFGSVLLFYSAVGSGPDSVGLAISHDDGVTFRKYGNVFTGRAPEVVLKDDLLHLLFQRAVDDTHYETFLAASADGMKWRMVRAEPVLRPGEAGSWNSFDVCTARVAESDGVFYALYAGSATTWDVPQGFGLARSTDLIDWEHHPGNPIFRVGAEGDPDGGGIWFPALLEEEGFFAMLYEGTRRGTVTSQICQASINT